MNRGRISPSPIRYDNICQAAISSACGSVCASASGCGSSGCSASCVACSCKAAFFSSMRWCRFRTLHYIRLGYWQVLRAYAFGRSQATGGSDVVAECVFEIGNQIIPADNGFLLGGKVLDDAHFVLARKVVIRAFIFNAYLIEMLFCGVRRAGRNTPFSPRPVQICVLTYRPLKSAFWCLQRSFRGQSPCCVCPAFPTSR